MPLAGTFDVLDFAEVMSLLSKRSSTGRLQVRTASMHGVIWLAGGRATAAEIGSASGSEARSKWRSQIEDICFDALRSPRGSFEFQPEDEGVIPPGPRVDLETLVESGQKRLEMWRDVESVIHSFEAVPRLAESLSEESITVGPDRWRVLVAIDGRRSVAALAKRLDFELLEFCQLLKPLVESGAVNLDHPDGWLKSLPKVRLEVGDIDPALVIDQGDPEESMAVVSVSSTVTSGPVSRRANGSARANESAAGEAVGGRAAAGPESGGTPGARPGATGDGPGLPGDGPGLPGDGPGLPGDGAGSSAAGDVAPQSGVDAAVGGAPSSSGPADADTPHPPDDRPEAAWRRRLGRGRRSEADANHG
jgi:hypothetical protein